MKTRKCLAIIAVICMLIIPACGKETGNSTSVSVSQTAEQDIEETSKTENAASAVNDTDLTDSTPVRSSVLNHPYPVDEYERAIFYGFIEDGVPADEAKGTVVSWAGFCELLGKMIKLYDETKLPEWETLTGGLTSAAIKRKGATVALLYAAETLGLNTVNTMSGEEYVSDPENTGPDEGKGILDEMAPLVKTINPMYGEAYLNKPRLYVSYDYAIKRISCITHRSLLEGKWRPDDKLTLYEAALSAVRLYESSEEKAYETAEMIFDKILETDEAKQIQAMADERRETIRNSTTDIVKSDKFIQGETYTGKAYYISQEGSDKNNGLSEETPWASPFMLAKINLKFGDAVFFKRGETWYNEELSYLLRAQGITVSAYGTGDKPRFYGSLENSAGKEKWELSFETEEGIKIWKYYQAMPDASVIVMNGGEQYVVRSCPYWDGNEYHELTYNGLNEEPYDFRSALQDMEFFHDLRYTSSVEIHGRVFETGYDRKGRATYLTGDLYLRCDAGNPGELFDDIQIPTPSCFISGLPSYTTIDNIEISYSGAGMATGHENGKNDHIYIQNCESSWMGGAIYNYYSDPSHQIQKMGGTFNVGCAGNVIRNNYSHHIYQEGASFESFEGDDGMLEDVTIEGNLLEYCTMGSLIINWDKDVKESHIFKNFVYRNNMVLYSGFESFYNDPTCDLTETGSGGYHMEGDLVYDSRCIGIIGCPLGMNAHDGTLTIENNLFAFSFGKLIDISFFTDEYSKVFHGNTYAQLPGFCWLSAYRDGESFERPRELDPVTAMEKIGDDSAAVIRFDE